MAAATQGGGMGIMGDFLLAESNRFGGGLTETLAGPLAGTVGDAHRVLALGFRGEAKGGDLINLFANNTPFANLWYLRPLMDYTFLYSLREFARPGYMRRRERNMKKEGRDLMFPPSQYAARPFG